jgi:cobalt-zinc-cadmium efflux system protein
VVLGLCLRSEYQCQPSARRRYGGLGPATAATLRLCPTIGRMSRQARLGSVLVLNLLLVTALVIVGLHAHSLAVLAAGGDYLADAAAIGVSMLAIWLAHRPPSPRRPDGYPNATSIAALVNGGWLLVLNVLIILAAVDRLVSGVPEVEAVPMLVVSGVAAVVMLVGALILRGDRDEDPDGGGGGDDLNVRAVLLDTAADAAAAAGVAVSGAIILVVHGGDWLDPAVALAIGLIVSYHAVRLVQKVVVTIRANRKTTRNPTSV